MLIAARPDDRRVTRAIRAVEMSRILRCEIRWAYEIHTAICGNSSRKPCLTYGFVGYGYVSVMKRSCLQAVIPEEHDDHFPRHGRPDRRRDRSLDQAPGRPAGLRGRADFHLPARPGRPVRRHPAGGPAGRHTAVVGLGPGLARRGHRPGLLLGLRARHHGRLPPVLHPRVVQGHDRPAGGAGRRGQPGHRGTGHHLGVRPPQAPQVQRQGRRPALALAVRGRLEGAVQGAGLRAHRVAVRPQQDLAGEGSRPTCSPTSGSSGSTACSRCWWPSRCCCPR